MRLSVILLCVAALPAGAIAQGYPLELPANATYHGVAGASWGALYSPTPAEWQAAWQSKLNIGETTDPLYTPLGVQIATGALSVRTQPYGPFDDGVVGSLMCGSGGTAALRAGVTGNATSGVAGIAGYGSFDEVGLFVQCSPQAPLLSLTGATYTATDITPAAALTAAQLATVEPYEYVTTSSGGWGAYVSSATATDIKLVGWAVLGGGNPAAGQVPPAGLSIYLGAPTSVFAKNTVVSLESGAPQATVATGEEFDVVNNTGAHSTSLNGVKVLGMGTGGGGTGWEVGGTGGYSNAFDYALKVDNFRNTGIQVGQTSGNGGVGVDVEMTTGTCLNIGNKTSAVASIDCTGALTVQNDVVVQKAGVTVGEILGDGSLTLLPQTVPGITFAVSNSGNMAEGYNGTQEWALTNNGQEALATSLTVGGTAKLLPLMMHLGTTPVAGLGACTQGDVKFAADLRNAGEAAGAGTGNLVVCNKANTWITAGGAAVTN